MSERHEWVLLVECYNMAELHTLRSTLQAHGIPFRVDGEHTHGILGPIQGAMARSRVMVPRPALAEARALSEDIVGPFDDSGGEDHEPAPGSPFRVPAPAEERVPATTTVRPKSFAALSLIGLTGLALLGVGHVYVGRNTRAGMLAFATLAAVGVLDGSATLAVLTLVWIADMVGGGLAISQHNADVRTMDEQSEDEADDEDEERGESEADADNEDEADD